jgi:hypothetical protein
MRKIIFSMLGFLLLLSGRVAAESSHAQYFEHYEGTKTCLQCHQKEAENFFHSQHYQWQGEAPQIINSRHRKLGKINTINDFCTNPQANWIGLVTNSRGEPLSKGCSACHPGWGKLPTEEMSPEQLENIDCLICHAAGYRRDLVEIGEKQYEWRPMLWKNKDGLDSVSKRISLPKRAMCLRCHSSSGGGPNWKRGDLEYKLNDCDSDFDVHMASNGLNLQCVSCHAGEDHRVRGRGTDLAGTDFPSKPLSCDNRECHGPTPHKAMVLNHHLERIYCTTCHISRFAKEDATDMVRDWSKPAYHPETDKYTATITLAKDVKPVYAWYNGTTKAQLPAEPALIRSDGTVGIMIPQGLIGDPKSKIYAFKLHRGKLPVLNDRNWVVPIVVEEFFVDGKIDPAVRNAAKDLYKIENAQYSWKETVRYMGLFHEVQPASKALQCLDCHGPEGRMEWKNLGYNSDPLQRLMDSRSKKAGSKKSPSKPVLVGSSVKKLAEPK